MTIEKVGLSIYDQPCKLKIGRAVAYRSIWLAKMPDNKTQCDTD